MPNLPTSLSPPPSNKPKSPLPSSTSRAPKPALVQAQQTAASAAADLAASRDEAANAAREEERYGELVGKQEVSREQYDQKATAARAEEASLSPAAPVPTPLAKRWRSDRRSQPGPPAFLEARANLPRNVAIQNATVATRIANVEAAKAQVEQAALNLQYCKILAPGRWHCRR